MKNWKYALCVFACYGLWGILPIFWKIFKDLPAMYTLAIRMAWALPVCLLFIGLRHKFSGLKGLFRDRKRLFLILLAAVLLSCNNLIYVLSIALNRMVEMSLGYFIQPLITVILGIIFFKERLNKVEGTAIGLAAIGVCIMIIRMGKLPWIALLSATFLPIYCAVKRHAGVDGDVSVTMESIVVFPFFLIYALIGDFNGIGAASVLSGVQLIAVPLAGLFSVLPVFLLSLGVNKVSFSTVGVLAYVSPTTQLLLGVLLYKEEFSMGHLLAFAFIWAGIILFSVSNFKKAKRQTAEVRTE